MDRRGFGHRLRLVIESSGASNVSEFAKRLGISPTALYSYVKGTRAPDADVLARLHQLTKVDVGWLLTGERQGGLAVAESVTPYGRAENEEEQRLLRLFREMGERREGLLELLERMGLGARRKEWKT